MAYFIPLDLSFTFWFFYIFWKFEMIFGSIAGLQRIPGFPFIFDQSFGVCIGVLGMTLWSARHHLQNVLARAWRANRETGSNEPISYRAAVIGLICGFLMLVGFWWIAKTSTATQKDIPATHQKPTSIRNPQISPISAAR